LIMGFRGCPNRQPTRRMAPPTPTLGRVSPTSTTFNNMVILEALALRFRRPPRCRIHRGPRNRQHSRHRRARTLVPQRPWVLVLTHWAPGPSLRNSQVARQSWAPYRAPCQAQQAQQTWQAALPNSGPRSHIPRHYQARH
jgi:hypothetical protein